MPVIRAARLIRVSSGKQAKDDRTSLPYQRKALTEICERNGWLSLEEDLYIEVISGAKGRENRATLTLLLDEIKRGRYQRLCVLDFDRSTRKGLGEWEEIKDILRDAECKIVINGTVYDVEDEDQEFQTDIQAVVAKRERQMIRRRTVRGQEANAQAGGSTGGQVPYGYRSYYPQSTSSDRPKKVVEIDPFQAEAVRLAFELYSGGVMGYPTIADELNRRGYKALKDAPFVWTTIHRIIRNPSYAGLSMRRRPYTKAQHKVKLPSFTVPSKVYPPIISIELWERCQAIRENKPKHAKLSNLRRRPLSGLLRCATCGGPMLAAQTHDVNTKGEHVYWHYYRCAQKVKRLGDCPAPQNFRMEVAHQAVINGIKKILAQAPMAVAEHVEESPIEARAIDLKARLDELEAEEMDLLARLRKPIEDGGIREDQFKRYNQGLLAKRDALEAEVRALRRKAPRPIFDLPDVAEAIETLTIDDPRLSDVVRSIFQEIRMVRTGKKYVKREWSAKPVDWVRLKNAVLVNGVELSL
jgi:site-specific DNA recombinase